MLCRMPGRASPVWLVICLAVFVSACSQDASEDAPAPPGDARVVVLREGEHRTVAHPDKRYFAMIWPDGLQVSFHAVQGHFGSYTFPTGEFPQGEPVFLSCPGSPDLLPMRVVRLNGEADQRYRIEWLAESPATLEGARKVVRSY